MVRSSWTEWGNRILSVGHGPDIHGSLARPKEALLDIKIWYLPVAPDSRSRHKGRERRAEGNAAKGGRRAGGRAAGRADVRKWIKAHGPKSDMQSSRA